MKVVTCQKCGEKYQLNDNEDVNSYECNICTGNLVEENKNPTSINKKKSKNNNHIVYCEECGLKYNISSKDNIEEYECDSCGGELRFAEEELNKKNSQTANIPQHNNLNELKQELEDIRLNNSLHNTNIISPEHNPNDNYELTLYTYYNELKQDLKRTYLQHILETPYDGGMLDQLSNRLKDKIKSNHIDLNYPELNNSNLMNKPKNSEDSFYSKYLENLTQKEFSILFGTIITIIGLLSILIINIGHSILILILGIILLVYGFYEQKDPNGTDNTPKQVVRSKLLTLPKEYYVLYHVKTPGTNVAINHVVIGPSGIFTIITQKTNPQTMNQDQLKSKFNIFENNSENKYDLISTNNNNLKFNDELELKQKTLTLNRLLFEFLDENGFTIPIEPFIGFVNDDVAIINDILNDNDLFMDEILNKILHAEVKLDTVTIRKTAILLSHYSINCPN